MGFIPVQPRQTREMRERYRKTRRRQQAQLLLLGCGALLLCGSVALAWRFATRPAKPHPAESASKAKDKNNPQGNAPLARLAPAPGLKAVAEQNFSAAPWLLETDGETIFTAVDEAPFSPGAAYYSCDMLRARAIRGGKTLWETPGELKLSALDYAGGMLVGLLESPADKKLLLTGVNAALGTTTWTAEIADAAKSRLHAEGKQVILAYSAPGGYRISCYDSATGTKTWGIKPSLRGLNQAFVAKETAPTLQLLTHDDTLVYVFANVIGLLDRNTGKPLRSEFTASGPLLSAVIQEESRTVFVKMQGNARGSSSILAIPLGEGSPRFVQRVLSADNRVLFIPGPQWLLTAYRKMESGTPRLVLEAKRLDEAEGAGFKQELAGGQAVCGALVPGSDSFLIGVAAETGTTEGVSGARQFYLVSPAAHDVREAGRTSQPAFELMPFKDNLLALCDGAQLQRFDPARLSFSLLRKLRYPQPGLQLSEDRKTLLAYSSTAAYMEGQPGEPLQAVIIR